MMLERENDAKAAAAYRRNRGTESAPKIYILLEHPDCQERFLSAVHPTTTVQLWTSELIPENTWHNPVPVLCGQITILWPLSVLSLQKTLFFLMCPHMVGSGIYHILSIQE